MTEIRCMHAKGDIPNNAPEVWRVDVRSMPPWQQFAVDVPDIAELPKAIEVLNQMMPEDWPSVSVDECNPFDGEWRLRDGG